MIIYNQQYIICMYHHPCYKLNKIKQVNQFQVYIHYCINNIQNHIQYIVQYWQHLNMINIFRYVQQLIFFHKYLIFFCSIQFNIFNNLSKNCRLSNFIYLLQDFLYIFYWCPNNNHQHKLYIDQNDYILNNQLQ